MRFYFKSQNNAAYMYSTELERNNIESGYINRK